MTEEELEHLHRQLPGLPVGWEPAVADLIAEVRRLRQALKDVCSPMQMFLRSIPEDQRQYVDSGTMVRLCESIGFIQEIARKALEVDRT